MPAMEVHSLETKSVKTLLWLPRKKDHIAGDTVNAASNFTTAAA